VLAALSIDERPRKEEAPRTVQFLAGGRERHLAQCQKVIYIFSNVLIITLIFGSKFGEVPVPTGFVNIRLQDKKIFFSDIVQ
jgi:hypothetical protein